MENKPKLEIRPKKYKGETAVMSLRLPEEVIAKIDRISQQSGRTRNELVLHFIEYALDNVVVVERKED